MRGHDLEFVTARPQGDEEPGTKDFDPAYVGPEELGPVEYSHGISLEPPFVTGTGRPEPDATPVKGTPSRSAARQGPGSATKGLTA